MTVTAGVEDIGNERFGTILKTETEEHSITQHNTQIKILKEEKSFEIR